ncbi:hypothetical protein DYH10_00220 [Candidatus Saccharibacteria bacterium CPR2]|nr:hypothetical protein [Candidatus Saccharibacteria bacterium CPR2]
MEQDGLDKRSMQILAGYEKEIGAHLNYLGYASDLFDSITECIQQEGLDCRLTYVGKNGASMVSTQVAYFEEHQRRYISPDTNQWPSVYIEKLCFFETGKDYVMAIKTQMSSTEEFNKVNYTFLLAQLNNEGKLMHKLSNFNNAHISRLKFSPDSVWIDQDMETGDISITNKYGVFNKLAEQDLATFPDIINLSEVEINNLQQVAMLFDEDYPI